ncbi:hypothetical protein GCM10010129_17060 [Streptomyces fumigatiscleroticus]|nr:hypothetical protein GCM10010129_17060 [Streptomyces fumigatiscleroticus]
MRPGGAADVSQFTGAGKSGKSGNGVNSDSMVSEMACACPAIPGDVRSYQLIENIPVLIRYRPCCNGGRYR